MFVVEVIEFYRIYLLVQLSIEMLVLILYNRLKHEVPLNIFHNFLNKFLHLYH